MRRTTDYINAKLLDINGLRHELERQRLKGKTIVFTNGCFDILHPGHLLSLSSAAALGDYLVVAINSDASVQRLKGPTRPVNNAQARASVLAALMMVDAVIVFEEDTPRELITTLLPDVLAKGGDYTVEQIAGAAEVLAHGGRVEILPLLPGVSTTGIVERMKT